MLQRGFYSKVKTARGLDLYFLMDVKRRHHCGDVEILFNCSHHWHGNDICVCLSSHICSPLRSLEVLATCVGCAADPKS